MSHARSFALHNCLVVNLEPKLDHARIGCSGRDGAECAATDYPVGLTECRCVGQIEYLRTGLQIHPLPHSRVFDKLDIGILIVGPAHWIARSVAQGELWRCLECCCVEPFRRASLI